MGQAGTCGSSATKKLYRWRPMKTACGGLPDDDVDDVAAVEPARLAQEGLDPVVVLLLAALEAGVVVAVGIQGDGLGECPARERAGRVLDVQLGVAADAHREELQQLASVVLVRLAAHVLVVVQPVDHGRVARELQEDRAHVGHADPAEHLHLAVECGDVLALEEGRGEYVVPEEGHLLLERPACDRHTVHPPHGRPMVAVPAVVAVAEVGIDVGEALGVEQVVHHVVIRAGRQGFQLAAGGAESGPPHQVSGESQIAITHACSPPNGVSGICAAFYITAQPRTIAGRESSRPSAAYERPYPIGVLLKVWLPASYAYAPSEVSVYDRGT